MRIWGATYVKPRINHRKYQQKCTELQKNSDVVDSTFVLGLDKEFPEKPCFPETPGLMKTRLDNHVYQDFQNKIERDSTHIGHT